jgi:hypothetical protein
MATHAGNARMRLLTNGESRIEEDGEWRMENTANGEWRIANGEW